VVTVEVWRIVIQLEHGLTKEDEGPRDGEAVRRLPFFPDAVEGLPNPLSRNTIHEAVLGGFWEAEVAAFAVSLNTHCLEPSAHRQALVEGQPDKCSDFAQASIMPHPRDDLGDSGVVQVEVLNEG